MCSPMIVYKSSFVQVPECIRRFSNLVTLKHTPLENNGKLSLIRHLLLSFLVEHPSGRFGTRQ